MDRWKNRSTLKLADGTLDKLIKRQQAKGWKMKGASFVQDDFWCCVMIFDRGVAQ